MFRYLHLSFDISQSLNFVLRDNEQKKIVIILHNAIIILGHGSK